MEFSMDVNPYAPVTDAALNPYTGVGDDVEATRRRFLSHEASIQSIGVLYLIGGVLSVLYGAFMISMALAGFAQVNAQQVSVLIFPVILGFVVLALGVAQGYAGHCMRILNPSGKVLAIIMAAIGLIAVPLGTLISIYVLWLLLSEKGNVVFSPEYRRVIDATPHIKYRTSIIVWVFVFLLIALVLLGIFGFALSATTRTVPMNRVPVSSPR